MRSLFIFLIPLLALGIGQVTKSFAAEIEISKAWLRASIGQSSVTAGYFTMQNISDQDDRLLSIQTFAAAKVEIHMTRIGEGGIMRMRPMGGLTILAGESASFLAGRDHIMLTGLTAPIKAGNSIELTLTFEHAGNVRVAVPVARRNPFP
ncbi:MAG: copper chaperone PCu(A)C [Rhodospirillales bacterium]|jgi:copper(I)-binding protein